jgi:hypothetical protein
MHLRHLETERASDGFQTHLPAHFIAFLNEALPHVQGFDSLHLVTDVTFLSDTQVSAMAGPSTSIQVQPLPEGIAWHDFLQWWLQPLVAQGLVQGRLGQFAHLEQALTDFMKNGDPDPFWWVLGRP